MNTAKSVAGVEGSLASFTLYSLRLENESVVIAVVFPMPAGETNFSNFPPRAVDEKENRNQPVSQLASLKFTAVSVQAEASPRRKILKQYTTLGVLSSRYCPKERSRELHDRHGPFHHSGGTLETSLGGRWPSGVLQ